RRGMPPQHPSRVTHKQLSDRRGRREHLSYSTLWKLFTLAQSNACTISTVALCPLCGPAFNRIFNKGRMERNGGNSFSWRVRVGLWSVRNLPCAGPLEETNLHSALTPTLLPSRAELLHQPEQIR